MTTIKTLRETLSTWNHLNQVKFALFCAKKVAHLNPDKRANEAILAAEKWLEEPSEENRKLADAAANAAANAAYAAYAAANALGVDSFSLLNEFIMTMIEGE